MSKPVHELIEILLKSESPSVLEVMRKHEALQSLSALGEAASDALPAIAQTLLQTGGPDVRPILHVAAAEAVWKIGGNGHRHLAMAILTWWLPYDHVFGITESAAEVLAEMGEEATESIPALLGLAERRLDQGHPDARMVLPVIASALANCARGLPTDSGSFQSVRETLHRIARDPEVGEDSAVSAALERLESRVG